MKKYFKSTTNAQLFDCLAPQLAASMMPPYLREARNLPWFRIARLKQANFGSSGTRVVHREANGKGRVHVTDVCDFLAWVSEDSVSHAKSEPQHFLKIEGWSLSLKKELPALTIAAEKLADGKWVAGQWGSDALLCYGGKRYLAELIHAASCNIHHVHRLERTGWIQLNDEWEFLHAGGATGSRDVVVDLVGPTGAPNLERYRLPEAPLPLSEVAPTALQLLDAAKPHVSYPLLAAVFLAPLGECLRQNDSGINFTLFLLGKSESGKSSLAALYQAFFGDFGNGCFAANFTDTPSSLESKLQALQDVLMVVDDCFPSTGDVKANMDAIMQKVVRAVSDGNLRSRMGQTTFVTKAFPLCTGELRPSLSPSALSRVLFVDMQREDLDYKGSFRKCWSNRDHLRHFMANYLEWIAQNWDTVCSRLRRSKYHFQDLARNLASGRSTEAVIKLAVGLDLGLEFLHQTGCVDAGLVRRHRHEAAGVLAGLLRSGDNQNSAQRPGEVFLSSLNELAQAAKVELIPLHQKDIPGNWIGCLDEKQAYLLPSQAFTAVKAHCRQQGQAFPSASKDVWLDLQKMGLIEYDAGRSRFTRQKKFPCRDGKPIDVLVIPRNYLSGV